MPSRSPHRPPVDEPSGTLYVVATPIGHRDDITVRALAVLRTADCIAAEDTRTTGRLLAHHRIKSHLISYHEHNEKRRTPQLMARLKEGQTVALVSDAGTPTLSDPGFILVREAAKAGMCIRPLPGASAAMAALSVSGLPTDAFVFLGFPPRKPQRLETHLRALHNEPRTLIWYESPRRLKDLLQALERIMGDRPAVIGREMTKRYEEFLRAPLSQLIKHLETREDLKGEITLLVGGYTPGPESSPDALQAIIREELKHNPRPAPGLARELAARFNRPRGEIYNLILDVKKR
ncbi:MAG: 16S rRNA (cytidine(1402)-2'-O)-methyltransferase [Desulfobacterales bacterium]|jgi:16S rRNA (cytidine1402-2'-O)-methyltransferase